MRKTLLVLCLTVGACAKHAGEQIAINKNLPQAPINQPDTSVQPPTSNNSDTHANHGAGNGSGAGGGELSNGGGNGEPGSGSSQNSGGSEPGGGPSGGPSGQPVPEPGTLLLVGTGLAGIALLRRRREARPE